MSDLRKRFEGHSVLNDLIRQDWIDAINLNPDRWEALLYSPKSKSEETAQDDDYQEEVVTEMDTHADTLEYNDPDVVAVVDCNDDSENFFMMDDTGETLGEGEQALMLRIAASPVAVGSVLEWEEETGEDSSRRVWWYVHSAIGYGTAAVGAVYACIPMRNFEATDQYTAEGSDEEEESTTEETSDDSTDETTTDDDSTVIEV